MEGRTALADASFSWSLYLQGGVVWKSQIKGLIPHRPIFPVARAGIKGGRPTELGFRRVGVTRDR